VPEFSPKVHTPAIAVALLRNDAPKCGGLAFILHKMSGDPLSSHLWKTQVLSVVGYAKAAPSFPPPRVLERSRHTHLEKMRVPPCSHPHWTKFAPRTVSTAFVTSPHMPQLRSRLVSENRRNPARTAVPGHHNIRGSAPGRRHSRVITSLRRFSPRGLSGTVRDYFSVRTSSFTGPT